MKVSDDDAASLQTSTIGGKAVEEVEQDLEDILSGPIIDMQELKKLVWRGIPDRFRAICWKLMMGYLPPDTRKHSATLQKRLALYKTFSSKPEQVAEEAQIRLDGMHRYMWY